MEAPEPTPEEAASPPEVRPLLDRLVHRIPEGAYRVLGTVFFTGCAAWRAMEYGAYGSKALWALEVLIYLLIAGSYTVRKSPRSRARGGREIVVPLLGAVWPFLLLFQTRGPFGLQHQSTLFWAMCAGTGLAVWGYLSLNEAFSILVEARTVKTGGPYRLIRHPVYTGQILTACAVTAWRFSWLNVALTVAFAGIQAYRATLEEAKLSTAFPAYRAYRKTTGMFLPWV